MRLVYRAATNRDFINIYQYVKRKSSNDEVAEKFVGKIFDYCEHLAELPSLLGRARPDLGPNYRSITFNNYVIIIRYADENGPRSHLYIVRIIHGSRDLDAYFTGGSIE